MRHVGNTTEKTPWGDTKQALVRVWKPKILVLFQQNQNRSKINKAKKCFGELIIASGDAPKLLDFLPKTLDQMTLFVQPPVAFALCFVCLTARDVWGGAKRREPVNKLLAIIAFISVYYAAVD